MEMLKEILGSKGKRIVEIEYCKGVTQRGQASSMQHILAEKHGGAEKQKMRARNVAPSGIRRTKLAHETNRQIS